MSDRREPPLIVAIPLLVVLGVMVLVCFALDDAYRYIAKFRRRNAETGPKLRAW